MRTYGFAVLLLAGALALPAQQSQALLPTAPLAAQVRELPDQVRSLRAAGDSSGIDTAVARARTAVSQFVVRQLDAYPSISACALQKQIGTVFGSIVRECSDAKDPDRSDPRVFADDWGPATSRRVFAITYCMWLGFYGERGYETVLESYVWERGRGARPGGRFLPPGFSGMITRTAEVCRFPDSRWLLVAGAMSGASGQVIRGAAAVVEVGEERERVVWTTPPNAGNVRAHAHAPDLRWEVEYADPQRFYARLPNATALEIYRVDWAGRKFARLARVALD